MEKTCANCKKNNNKNKLCGRCKDVYYCSIKCQKEDYKNHKTLCIFIDDNNKLKKSNKDIDQKVEVLNRQYFDHVNMELINYGECYRFKIKDGYELKHGDEFPSKIDIENEYKKCGFCGHCSKENKICKRCNAIYYCSIKCKSKDKQYHKKCCDYSHRIENDDIDFKKQIPKDHICEYIIKCFTDKSILESINELICYERAIESINKSIQYVFNRLDFINEIFDIDNPITPNIKEQDMSYKLNILNELIDETFDVKIEQINKEKIEDGFIIKLGDDFMIENGIMSINPDFKE